MPALLWSPIHHAIDKQAQSGDNLFFVVAPFVKLEALKRLFESVQPDEGLKLICRWLPGDLASGVSDLETFGYLRARGCQLYVNPRVHLKLYAFESNNAIATSANLTLAGLGYLGGSQVNVEVGTNVALEAADWISLYKLVVDSRLMTAELYARFVEYADVNRAALSRNPPPDLLGPPKKYTISSLPAVDNPEDLERFYFGGLADVTAEFRRRAYHDLATFDIPAGLNRQTFQYTLARTFRENPFVSDLIEHMQHARTMHFGAVNSWIHERCEDVPLPYKWDLKSTTHALYNWLSSLVPELSWDRPAYSQILRWRTP